VPPSYSYQGQDLFVLDALGHQDGGYFLDSGASNGVRGSNTKLLESVYGWRGICVEPNERLFAELVRNRTCVCLDCCLYDREGPVEFFEAAEVYGGIVPEYVPDHLAFARAHVAGTDGAPPATAPPTVLKPARTIASVLRAAGAPRVIDYWSLDTEGSELTLLRSFPFDQYRLRVLTVEHNNASSREAIRAFLATHGYHRVRSLGIDDAYIHTIDLTPHPPRSRTPPGREAVFVLAPARSGSSVVAAMVGQHPELYGFPELRLFRAEVVRGLLAEPPGGEGMPARQRTAGLVRALAQLHEGEQSGAAADRAWCWLEQRADWSVAAVLAHLLALVSPRVGVEKSPETSASDRAMDRMARACPDARYLHLVRHPWSTVASMLDAWSGLDYWDVPAERAPQRCLEVWYEHHRRIAAFGAGLDAGRFLRVRAEDVVDRPDETLPTLCGWLGVDAGDEAIALMKRPDRSCYAAPGPDNAPGGYDPKFLHDPRRHPIRPADAPTPPPTWPLDPTLTAAAVALAHSFGYAAVAPPLRRALGLPRRSWASTTTSR
jgi:hypothetical protein